jgi:nucleoside-diphosphate-sugar epimerase
MRVFITGASGFIGKNLIPYLLDQSCQLTCLVRDPRRLPEKLRSQVTVVVDNLLTLGQDVQQALDQVDAIVHLAGQPWGHSYRDFDKVNRAGAENLVQAAAACKNSIQRFIFVSTLAAAGPAQPGNPLTEDSTGEPISWYGRSKLAGEQTLAEAPFPWTVLRPPTVYGPYDQDVRRFFKLAKYHLGPQLTGSRPEISLIHVQDVCHAIWLILSKEQRPVSTYFVNDGEAIHTLRDTLTMLAETVGTWTIPLPIPTGLLWVGEMILALGQRIGVAPRRLTSDKLRELRQPAWTCTSDLIAHNLGYQPSMPLKMGLAHTYAWYREAGWL